MSNMTTAVVIILSINVIFFLAQAAMTDISQDSTQFYNGTGSVLCSFESSGCTGSTYQVNSQDPANVLPSVDASVSPTTGNIFTDTFTSIKNWLLDNSGIGFLLNILGAPVSFMNAIGLPSVVSFAIGAMWYGLTLFLIISWIAGRND